ANRAKDIALEFKRRGKTVIMGGPMVSLVPDLAAQYCDAVVIGDAENLMTQICADLENGTLAPRYESKITGDLNTPLPRYDLVANKKIGNFLPVQAGRGCPHSCKFCTIYCLYRGRYLRRPVDEVVRDIQAIKDLGFSEFLLIDDNIVSRPGYLAELCERIKPLGMTWSSQCSIKIADRPDLLKLVAESGCQVLSFGLESISRESLLAVNKDWCDPADYARVLRTVTDAGIEIASEMIVGIDTDTRESLLSTIDFVSQSDIVAPKFYCMTPIPGTDMYDELKAEGRITDPDVLSYHPARAVINTPNLSATEVEELFWQIYRSLYTIPMILRRTIFHRRMRSRPGQTLFFLMVNLVYRSQIKRGISPNIL
ncbi:MAG: B12-binding domain-containing radical SAM protein, partial [Propionibacteriaceae bacterium]|nr:B12-binding domain-containing radical SAM protein [Propionibacteriaceae bacterium]